MSGKGFGNILLMCLVRQSNIRDSGAYIRSIKERRRKWDKGIPRFD
jgi:hypothetical protein